MKIVQEFEVLCVSKRALAKPFIWESGDLVPPQRFLPGGGPGKIVTEFVPRYGLHEPISLVEFNGKKFHRFGYVSGLEGSSTTLLVEVEDDAPYTHWELHTNIPAHDRYEPGTVERVAGELMRARARKQGVK